MHLTDGVDVHAHYLPGWAATAGLPAELHDLGRQLSQMDGLGVRTRVVAPPPFALRDRGQDDGYHRRWNEDLASALAGMPAGRFAGLATVPLHRPADAARELAHAVERLGLRGALIGASAGEGGELDHPALEPFWTAAEALAAVLLVHPAQVPGEDRMTTYHLRNLVGNPLATAHAAARLIFGGVLDRHPRLRIVLAHGGGALAWLAGRLDRGYAVRPECATCRDRPSSYLSRFYYDTVLFDAAARRWLAAKVGEGRILFGTDAPFDMADDGGGDVADHAAARALFGLGGSCGGRVGA